MGLLTNILSGKYAAAKAQNQAAVAESNAKLKQIEHLASLSDIIAQFQQQQTASQQTGMEGSPGNPDAWNAPEAPDPERLKVPLLQLLAQTNPTAAGQLLEQMTDPKRKIAQNYISGSQTGGTPSLNLQSGQQQDPLVEGIQNQDPGAMLTGGALGLPVSALITNKTSRESLALRQKQYDLEKAKGIRFVEVDKTGKERERYVDAVTRTPIIGPTTDAEGWVETKAAPLQPVDIKVGGKMIRIWVTPKDSGGVDLGPEDQRVITEKFASGESKTKSIPMSEQFSVTSEQPKGEMPIEKTDFNNWINPETGQHPTKTMTTAELQAGGFVPYQKMTGEQAPRFAKAVNALDQLPTVAAFLFDDKGNLNRKNWMKMKAGIGEGAGMKGTLLQAAWAQIRNESGAAVTDKEVSDLANQYVSNLLSVTDPKGMLEGMRRLGADLKGYIDVFDPTGIHQKIVRKDPYKMGKKVEPRKPGESAGDYLKRTGG